MKFRLKTLTRLSNMQLNYAKVVKKRTRTSYECFPIVSAWFAAHFCGLRSENHEISCDFPLVLSLTSPMLVDVKEPYTFIRMVTDARNTFKTFVCVP